MCWYGPPSQSPEGSKHAYPVTLKAGICREVPSSPPWGWVHKEQKAPGGCHQPIALQRTVCHSQGAGSGAGAGRGWGGGRGCRVEDKSEADVPGATVTSKFPAVNEDDPARTPRRGDPVLPHPTQPLTGQICRPSAPTNGHFSSETLAGKAEARSTQTKSNT